MDNGSQGRPTLELSGTAEDLGGRCEGDFDRAAWSRKNGWELMRQRMFNAAKGEGQGLYVFDTCPQFIRTVPSIRRDDRDMDDVDTDAEDHVADEARYRCLTPQVLSSLEIG